MNKTKFEFRFKGLVFSVIYVAERFPQTLLLGCVSHNLFFVLEVNERYEVDTYLNQGYAELVAALGITYEANNPFRTSTFFEALGNAVPIRTSSLNVPTTTDIARISRDIEEPNKIYFYGWLPHDGVKSSPLPENLRKTRRVCGEEAFQVCKKFWISSKWTADELKAITYYPPQKSEL